MYWENVHNWIEILLTGTPRPAQSGRAADAVPAPKPMHAATRAAAKPRNIMRTPPSG